MGHRTAWDRYEAEMTTENLSESRSWARSQRTLSLAPFECPRERRFLHTSRELETASLSCSSHGLPSALWSHPGVIP